jgi:hypothetical protein
MPISHSLGILLLTSAWLGYDHYRPWVNFHSEGLALAGIALLVLAQLRRKVPGATAPWIAIPLLAVALIPWVQYALGISFFAGDAVIVSLYFVGLTAAVWLGCNYASPQASSESFLASIFFAFWIGALASAIIGLLQWLNLESMLQMYAVHSQLGDRAMGNLGQPNQLATLLLMGMAALAWTFEKARIGRIGLFIGVAFLTCVLVMTQSRAGMISAVAMAGFLMWKNRTPARKQHGVQGLQTAAPRIRPLAIALWLVAYVAAVKLLPAIHELLLMTGARDMSPALDSARLTIWKQMLSGIAQAPWVGYGWIQTPTAHAFGSLAYPGSLAYSYAHSVILDVIAWNGLPLGLLLIGACGYWAWTRLRWATDRSAVYALACLLPIAIHSQVEFPFAYAYFFVAAGLMVGVVEAHHHSTKTVRVNPRWIGAALAAWTLVGGFVVYEYLLIEEDFRVVRFENMRIGQTPIGYEAPNIRLLTQLGGMLDAARMRPTPRMKSEDLENLRKSSLRFAYGALGLRYALALGLNGDPVGATRQMAILYGMYGNFYYRVCVAELRAMQAKHPELALVLTPSYP